MSNAFIRIDANLLVYYYDMSAFSRDQLHAQYNTATFNESFSENFHEILFKAKLNYTPLNVGHEAHLLAV